MATNITKSFESLQQELENAKNNLKGLDETIKKLIGRDPSENILRSGVKRPNVPAEEFRGRGRGFPSLRGRRELVQKVELSSVKKRLGPPVSVCSKLTGPPKRKKSYDSSEEDDYDEFEDEEDGEEEEEISKPSISSKVLATPKDVPSRKEAIVAQNSDEVSKARNRRMFGALLGTLQKFRQEETRMKAREDKKALVEKKLEEKSKREKEELKKERQQLFLERKKKQAEIKWIENKMQRIKELEEWESKHRPLLNFIQTKSKPHIFYLPKSSNPKSEEKLVASQKVITRMIEKKRADINSDIKRRKQSTSEADETAEKKKKDDNPKNKEKRLQSVGCLVQNSVNSEIPQDSTDKTVKREKHKLSNKSDSESDSEEEVIKDNNIKMSDDAGDDIKEAEKENEVKDEKS